MSVMNNTAEMEAKLQALFQTMVAESVIEKNSDPQEQQIIIENGQTVKFASQADKENAQAASHIISGEVIAETVYAEDGEEIKEEEVVVGDGGVQVEEEIESEEDSVKLVFQTNLEKPLQSGILKGLNRLDGFPCEYCPRILATKYSLMIHTRIHTGEKPHQCTVCSSKFVHPTDLRRHMLKHTGEKPFKCDVCGARFTQTTSLKGHSRQHPGEKPHKCSICGETFVAAVLLKTHERIHNQVQTFKCTHCDQSFDSVEQVMEHCQNFHTISLTFDQVQQTNKSQAEPTALVDVSSIMYGRKRKRGQFACDECDSVLTTAHSLQIHKRTHTGERPYACHLCDYRSICLSMLKRHVLTHSSEKPFQCDQCSKSFRQLPHLKKHQQIHENKQRKCRKCDQAFPKLSDLVQHWNNYHIDAERPHLCVDCFQEFSSEEELQEHKKEKHAWKQGEYACDKCGSVFNRKGNLKKHLESVDCSERPFGCDVCRQTYRKKKALEEHMLRDHGMEKDYQCKKCRKVFRMEKLLKMHEKRSHGYFKASCELCPRRIFESKKDLFDHKKRRHVARLVQVDVASTTKSVQAKEKDTGFRHVKVFTRACGRVQKHKEKLRRNRRATMEITNEEPCLKVPCRICGIEFDSHEDFTEHFQKHRKNPGYFPSDEELDEIVEKTSDNETPETQNVNIVENLEQQVDVGNYVLVELVGNENGSATDSSMNDVVKRLLSENPEITVHSQLGELDINNATVVAELILNEADGTSQHVENVQEVNQF